MPSFKIYPVDGHEDGNAPLSLPRLLVTKVAKCGNGQKLGQKMH